MTAYIVRRLLWVVVLLFFVSLLTFLIFYTLPSADPARLRAGRAPEPGDGCGNCDSLGLDRPAYVQYGDYMKNLVLHFDFGYSYQNNADVKKLIFSRVPATFSLTIGAVILWMLMGISVGILSAVRRQSKLDRAAMGVSLIGILVPVYWLGLVDALPVLTRTSASSTSSRAPIPTFPLPRIHRFGSQSLLMPWFVAVCFAAFYCAAAAGEPERGDGRGLHPHRAGEGALRERRVVLPARRALRPITPIVTVLRARPRDPARRRDPDRERC